MSFIHYFNRFVEVFMDLRCGWGTKILALIKFCVLYHSALKKVLGVQKYFSNHLICSIFQTITFEHFLNANMTRFMFDLKSAIVSDLVL